MHLLSAQSVHHADLKSPLRRGPEVRPLYYGMLLFSRATASVAGDGASLLNTSSSARTTVGGVKAWTVPLPAKLSLRTPAAE